MKTKVHLRFAAVGLAGGSAVASSLEDLEERGPLPGSALAAFCNSDEVLSTDVSNNGRIARQMVIGRTKIAETRSKPSCNVL
ncbi:MAG: hypothetical protein LBJ09_00245 [Clostridiales bacterium]|nr:hypothetical protein [Clostridiales bacterium]